MEDKRAVLQRAIKDTRSIPTLPGIIAKLSTLAANDKVSAHEMARVVSADQVLSAKVLRLVNSPFYGFSGRVSTVSNALILLGVNVVKSLAVTSSIFEMMEKHVVGLWEHSMGVATAAQIIARQLKLPDPEEISTAALLHDIGKVVVKINLKEEYDSLIALIAQKDLTMIEAEKELFGMDHTEVGAWLAKSWFLPEKLVEPIAFHHAVEQSSLHSVKTSVVHVADVLVKAGGFGFSGDDIVPQIQPAAWKNLGLEEAALQLIVEELEDRFIELQNFSMEIQSTDAART